MRRIIPNIVTEQEAKQLIVDFPVNSGAKLEDYMKDPFSKPLNKILGVLEEGLGKIKPPSFLKVEQNSEYGWHIDVGNNNHMPWCTHGCSLLLTNDFEGGTLEYEDGEFKRYLDLMLHDSQVRHRVNKTTKGTRHAFLLFLCI